MIKKNYILILFIMFVFNGCFFSKQSIVPKIDLKDDLSNYYIKINEDKYIDLKRTNIYELDEGKYNVSLNQYDDLSKITIKKSFDIELIKNSNIELIFNEKTKKEYEFDPIVKEFSKSFVETNKLVGFYKLENEKDNYNVLLIINKDGKSKILFNKLKIEQYLHKNIDDILFSELDIMLDKQNKVKININDNIYILISSIKDNCLELEIPTISLSNNIEYMKEKFCKFK